MSAEIGCIKCNVKYVYGKPGGNSILTENSTKVMGENIKRTIFSEFIQVLFSKLSFGG